MFSEVRLRRFLETAGHCRPTDLIHRFIAQIRSFAGDAPQSGDITALALVFRGGSAMASVESPSRR